MRRHYIDNLRWIVVLLLFPYHTFMIYNTFGESFYIKGAGITLTTNFIVAVWPWIMPLLFTVAGINSAYALKKRTTALYLKERVSRLLIPLLFGVLIIMPVITFFAERFHNGYTGNYFEQYILFFTKPTDLTGYNGGFTPGHLWFILYLFVISLMALPIMISYEKSRKKLPIAKLSLPILLSLFIIPLIMRGFLDISGKSVGEYFAFFMLGYFVISDESILEKADKYRFLLTGIFLSGMVVVIALFNIRPEIDRTLYDIIVELYAFSGILALIGLSRHYLNSRNKVMDYMRGSSFSVYLFHQLCIVVIAFYTFRITDSSFVQIILILLGSVPITFLTHEVTKRIPFARFAFGLKK